MSSKKLPIDKELFAMEIAKSREKGQLTTAACKMLYKFLDMHSSKFKYKNTELREDVRGWAMVIICNKWKQYDPLVSDNAFAYFWTLTFNALLAGWNKYNRKRKGTIHISLDALYTNDNSD